MNDLQEAFPNIKDYSLLPSIAHGLVATVSFHPREVERHTAGDLGIVLVRPVLHIGEPYRHELTIEREYSRGLLCQAKMFQRSHKWHRLSVTQT